MTFFPWLGMIVYAECLKEKNSVWDNVPADEAKHSASGIPSPSKSREKMEYAGMMELVDMRDLGAVTSVKNFSSIR